MSDNPFAEPDDPDRTVIRRPTPGGRRPATLAAAEETAPARPIRADLAAASEGPERVTAGGGPLLEAAAPLLQLLARLRNTLSQPDPVELRERAVREVRAFEQRARDAAIPLEQLRPAHYALCASLDDVVLNTPWGGHGGWESRSLVSTFHQEVRSGERFFDLLAQMRQNPGRFLPVIELMYLCLSLGFAGRTRLSPRGPAELDAIREETYALIARNRPPGDPDLSPQWRGVDAPYRPVRGIVPVWVAWSAALAAVAGLFAWALIGLNTGSDAVFNRMIAAPPAQMPRIARTVAAPPPPVVPPSAQPGALDKLRAFLKPEIDERLVSVLGTQSAPLVRVLNRGMFAPGSAAVNPSFVPLLRRIGAALREEPGAVLVAGYTDNQPIRTVRFPSNFQLSTARAEAAKAAIAGSLGDAARVTAEGRADADPLASNATPEGREQNRRIEVTLRRAG
ncbi:MAG: type VI secretion system protein TssL, long form [Acetobacteraceae bacterium]|nr:type VI secretion system protein TssL, long form [Acetobacteraceae bacterium]